MVKTIGLLANCVCDLRMAADFATENSASNYKPLFIQVASRELFYRTGDILKKV